jgi:hypothetical protein
LTEKAKGSISTLDLVLFALLTCDGDQRFVPTDEVAIQAFRLFPLKFCWDTFAHLPNWDRVRQWLSEAKKEKHGVLVEGFSGDRKEGWKLTPAGVRRLRFKGNSFGNLEIGPANEATYVHTSTRDLVTYAVEELDRSTRAPSLATITELCVRRFPALFELTGYQGWPDSATVAEGLRAATDEKLLEAGPTNGPIRLTNAGKVRAAQVRRAIASNTVSIRLEDIGRGLTHRVAKRVDQLTASRAWKLFKESKPVPDDLACEALQCSLQSHPKAIRRELDSYIAAATELNRQDVLDFLNACSAALGLVPTAQFEGTHATKD